MLIALCGYMGSGKSTIGKLLAKATGYDFLDIDEYIEKKQKRTIKEIFAQDGEEYFRKIETDTLKEVMQLNNAIISLGGGTILKEQNKQLLKRACVVFLQSDFEVCYKRICNSERPIVQRNTKEQLEEHFLQRQLHYKAVADIVVDANGEENSIVENIIKFIKEKL